MASLWLQLTTFLTMIVIGLVIGIGFDFYRVLRTRISFNWLVTDLVDILFALLAALVICGGLLYSNSGRVRIYFLAAVILGLIIYYFIFSDLVISFFKTGWAVVDWLQDKFKWVIINCRKAVNTIYQWFGDDNDE